MNTFLELLSVGVIGYVVGLLWGLEERKRPPQGAYGLPLCECPHPKDVIFLGGPRWTGWCGRCGRDLEGKP